MQAKQTRNLRVFIVGSGKKPGLEKEGPTSRCPIDISVDFPSDIPE